MRFPGSTFSSPEGQMEKNMDRMMSFGAVELRTSLRPFKAI